MDIAINELRTGNLLNYETSEGETLPTSMDWQDLRWLDGDSIGFNRVHSRIPITEDWLLKGGFVLEYKSDFTIKYTLPDASIGYDWRKVDGWAFRYFGNIIKCQFVHQLQNLHYALTGHELVFSGMKR